MRSPAFAAGAGARSAVTLARAEQLEAHAQAVSRRLESIQARAGGAT